MKIYFSLFLVALIIGFLLIVLGIVYRKNLSPVAMMSLILFGTLIAITSILMCLCLGFFMS